MTDTEKELIKTHLIEYADQHLTLRSADNNWRVYDCPICDSGKKDNHTPAFKIKPGSTKYHCFSCGKGGDIFNLINQIEFNGTADFPTLAKRAQDLYGNAPAAPARPAPIRPAAPEKPQRTETPAQIQNKLKQYLASCHALIGKTNYFSDQRGLTTETVSRFKLGYDQRLGSIIIPNDSTGTDLSYTSRTAANTTSKDGRYLKPAGMKCGIFNPAALRAADKPCFICEGAINAMSIMQAAGDTAEAIALNGTGDNAFFDQIYQLTNEGTPLPVFILALDEDQPGINAAENIAARLEKRNLPFIRSAWTPATEETSKDHPDSNDRLLHTPAQFKKDIKANIDRSAAAADEAQKETIEKIHALRASKKIIGFRDRAADNIAIPTGFKGLDNLLGGGLYAGLHILMAGSSLGKTTFALQMADQIAQSGHPVLFVSLEQSADDLIAKSLSRITYQICIKDGKDTRNAKAARSLLTPREYNDTEKELLKRAEAYYISYGDNLYIDEADRYNGKTVAEIGERMKEIKMVCRQTPVVIIDYLQILAAPESSRNLTDKQLADTNISQLYKTARDFKTPIIAISSTNRGAYYQKISMDSAKESGNIEYTADVLIGLEPADIELSNKEQENKEALDKYKKAPVKVANITILKNRLGGVLEPDTLKYFAVFNLFNYPEKDETGKRNDKYITLDEIPDDLPF